MTQLQDLIQFLQASAKELNRKKKQRKIIFSAITALMFIAVFAFILSETNRQKSLRLQEEISRTAKANSIATKAYTMLERDPTLAFRLAEASYNIEPTPLNKQVLLSAYCDYPFYRSIEGHKVMITNVVFSPDGRMLASEDVESKIIIWTTDGKKINTLFEGGMHKHNYNANYLAFSPDGNYIINALSDSTVRLWNSDGLCLAVLQHESMANTAYISSDNQHILTTSHNNAFIWNIDRLTDEKNTLKTPVEQQKINLTGHKSHINHANFSNDATLVITASSDKTLRVWDISGKCIKIVEHPTSVEEAYFIADDSLIVTRCSDQKRYIWNIHGKKTSSFGYGQAKIEGICVSDSMIATINNHHRTGYTVHLWDFNGQERAILKGHTNTITSAKFSADGKNIITASTDNTARIWALNGVELYCLKGHTSHVMSARFSPDGKIAASCSDDGTIKTWNISPIEHPVLKGHAKSVTHVTLSSDEQYIVTGAMYRETFIWNRQGRMLNSAIGDAYKGAHKSAFTSGNQTIIAILGTGKYSIRNNKGEILNYFHQHKDRDISFTELNNNLYLLLCTADGVQIVDSSGTLQQTFPWSVHGTFNKQGDLILLYNRDSSVTVGKRISSDPLQFKTTENLKIPDVKFIYNFNDEINNCEFSSDNRWLIMATSDSVIRLWDCNMLLSSKTNILPEFEYKHPEIIQTIKFADTSMFFLSVAGDNTVRIFETKRALDANNYVPVSLKGHRQTVTCAAFSSNARYVATGSFDNTIRVWDIGGRELQTLAYHKAAIHYVGFTKDSKFILSASSDRTARIIPWNVQDALHKVNHDKIFGDFMSLDTDKFSDDE